MSFINRYISGLLFRMYRYNNHRLRHLVLRIIKMIEGSEYYSKTIRDVYRHYHDVEVGMYTQYEFSSRGSIDRHTKIGRYCSIAPNVRIFNRNHPLEFKSTHAFFFNPILGICDYDPVGYIPLEIGHDVYIGHSVIILPHVRTIGTGASIGAGAVVNKDVPPYAVVVGNPSRTVRYRFPNEIIEELLASRWWEKSIEELKPHIREFQCFLDDSTERRVKGE
jgi:acetyltransferase-like isoleucine patch superfamily enzyme